MKLYRIAPLLAFAAATALPAAAQCAGSTCSWTQAAPSASYSSYAGASSYGSVPASQRLPGLAADEYLCPTDCATSVNVPAGGRVLDCFKVCKKAAPAPAPVYQSYTQAYQVVRPVVYVNYPVPVALPSCPIYDAPSRYGSFFNMRGRTCR